MRSKYHPHPGHQQELGQCPIRTYRGWSPSPSPFSPMSSSDQSTLAPTIGIIDASTSTGAKPSKSDSLLVSLKSASRTAAAARDSSSSGGSAAASGSSRGCCCVTSSATTRRTYSVKSLQSTTIHYVRPPRHQCLRSPPSFFVFKLDSIFPGLYRNIDDFRLLPTWKKAWGKRTKIYKP